MKDNTEDFDSIIIKNLSLSMSLGIYEPEKINTQPVLVNIIIEVLTNRDRKLQEIGDVLSYEDIVKNVKALSASKHFDLVEQFAEEIADLCLSHNAAKSCSVSIIKTQILPETSGVGVKIKRNKRLPHGKH